MTDRGQERLVVRQSVLSGGTATLAVGSGLVLDVVAAAVFGAGRDTDAFVVAARVPLALTAILMILGNQVLVASFAAWSVTLGRRVRRRLATTVLLGSVAVGAALALVLALAAPYLVVVLGPGFDREQHELAAELLRVMVWVIPLIAGCEALRAWLNARHRFVVPAAMTLVLNGVAVTVVLLGNREIESLPVAYVVGGVVQLLLMLTYAVAAGWRPAVPTLRHPEVGRLARLVVRPSAAATLNPLVRAAETAVASFLPPGSATVLHYGQRAVSAVGGTVLFRSVMLAVLPRLTRAHVVDDASSRRRLGDLGMQLMVTVSFPLTAVAVVLARPATEELLGFGRFSDADARLLGVVLTVLALSFPFSAVQRGLLAPCYATRDTRVPLHNTAVGAGVNLALLGGCLALGSGDDAVVAIAAAYVVANVANVLHARWAVGRSGLGVPRAGRRTVGRSTAAALAAATASGLVWTGVAVDPAWRLPLAGLAGVLAVLVVELPGRLPRRSAEPRSVGPRSVGPRSVEPRSGGRRAAARRAVGRGAGYATATLAAGTAAAASALSFAAGRDLAASLLPVGLLVGLAVLALALARFEVFVLALLVGRTSMDAFKTGSGTSVTEPAALVGLLFLGAGLAWLAAQWREDGAVRLSLHPPMSACCAPPSGHAGCVAAAHQTPGVPSRRTPCQRTRLVTLATPHSGGSRLSRLGVAVVAFAAAAFCGVLVSPELWPALVEWVRLSSVCTMVLVAERLARTPGFRERLVQATAAAAVVPLAVAAWQLRTGADLFDAGGFGRVRGTFTHSNPMAAFLAILLVMAFAYLAHLRDESSRLAAGAVCVAAAVGLYFTYTRAAWLAALLGITIVAWTKGRRWSLGVAGVVLVLLLTLPGAAARFSDLGDEESARGEPSNSLTWRAAYWGEALQLSADSPWTGIGLKQVVEESTESKQPHNDYLRAYVELGVLGMLAYAWLMVQLLATGVRAMRATVGGPRRRHAFAVGFCGVAAGYLLMSLVANLMSQVVVGIYFAALAGAASALVPRPAPAPPPVEQRDRRGALTR